MKRNLAGGAAIAAIATLAGALLLSGPFWSQGQAESVREIVLDAKGVAFAGNNPTLELVPGERVRFVVRNTDPGVLHAISIPGIDSEVRQLAYGDEVAFEITVPEGGQFEYICPQHAPKMKGKIIVRR